VIYDRLDDEGFAIQSLLIIVIPSEAVAVLDPRRKGESRKYHVTISEHIT
jgi:hypothetical protein